MEYEELDYKALKRITTPPHNMIIQSYDDYPNVSRVYFTKEKRERSREYPLFYIFRDDEDRTYGELRPVMLWNTPEYHLVLNHPGIYGDSKRVSNMNPILTARYGTLGELKSIRLNPTVSFPDIERNQQNPGLIRAWGQTLAFQGMSLMDHCPFAVFDRSKIIRLPDYLKENSSKENETKLQTILQRATKILSTGIYDEEIYRKINDFLSDIELDFYINSLISETDAYMTDEELTTFLVSYLMMEHQRWSTKLGYDIIYSPYTYSYRPVIDPEDNNWQYARPETRYIKRWTDEPNEAYPFITGFELQELGYNLYVTLYNSSIISARLKIPTMLPGDLFPRFENRFQHSFYNFAKANLVKYAAI